MKSNDRHVHLGYIETLLAAYRDVVAERNTAGGNTLLLEFSQRRALPTTNIKHALIRTEIALRHQEINDLSRDLFVQVTAFFGINVAFSCFQEGRQTIEHGHKQAGGCISRYRNTMSQSSPEIPGQFSRPLTSPGTSAPSLQEPSHGLVERAGA